MERFIFSRGSRIWTISEGHGVPMLLCSGGPGCCDYLELVSHMVADIAHVIRFEQGGCGRSDHNPP